jgi:hypothetical protein
MKRLVSIRVPYFGQEFNIWYSQGPWIWSAFCKTVSPDHRLLRLDAGPLTFCLFWPLNQREIRQYLKDHGQ